MTDRLAGKVALITGAGSGMGRAAAELFAREGARVVVSDLLIDAGNATVDAVHAAGGEATFVRADVSQWNDCVAMVRSAVDTYGGLHVLYNNAGIFPADDGGVLDTPESTWERVMDVNLKGVWLGCKAAIPALRDAGGGSIVNVASFVALMGAATAQIAYTASKGGVLAMTRELAVEYARQGIRANALVSGSDRDAAPPGAARRPPAARPADGAHPDGAAGTRRGAREGGALPRVRRLVVHDRRRPGRRRRHHRGVRHPRVKSVGTISDRCVGNGAHASASRPRKGPLDRCHGPAAVRVAPAALVFAQ